MIRLSQPIREQNARITTGDIQLRLREADYYFISNRFAGVPDAGLHELGSGQIRPVELGAGQVGPPELGAGQGRPQEFGPGQVRPVEPGAGQVRPPELSAGKKGTR